jgi:NADPH:quinone reductase-like Zn-dependent oxidoreductase
LNILEKIKAIVVKHFGGGDDYSNLALVDEDYPKIRHPNDVVVRIKAAGLNFAELIQRQGFYRPQQRPPYTPGFEGSGIVEKIGSGVTDFKVGDRVIVFDSHNIWKEVVCLACENMTKIPDSMSFEDAAGMMVNYLTAYHLLFEFGRIRPGSKVLIHMAGEYQIEYLDCDVSLEITFAFFQL